MIINNLAYLVKDFIIDLQNIGIHFYQIILGLLIFDFIIYLIIKLVIEAKKVRFY